MKTLSILQVCEATGIDRGDLNQWLDRKHLTATKYLPSTMGKARKFTKENTMEIALLHRLIDSGMKPSAAAAYIKRLFAELKAQKPQGFLVILGSGDFICADKPPSAALISATHALVINLAAITGGIDAYIASLEDDE